MKIGQLLTAFFLAFVIISCGSANKGANSTEYNEMVEKVRSLQFEIENEWANPMKYSRVNLISNPNHIRFEEDSVDVYLPFFGERHSGGGYNAEGAIIYEGPLEDLRIEEKPGREQIHLSFSGNRKNENFGFQLIIFPNGRTRTSVTSSQRDQINYDGRIINTE